MADERVETRRIIPQVDIYETPNEVILLADMPGVSKENLHVEIDKDELTISGKYTDTDSSSKKLLSECLYGEYYRVFTLSDTIDQEKITAKLDNGVLTVTLPKHEKVKPKKIAIEAS